MGIVQDANGERLDRTSDLLSYNAAYTWMCWANSTSAAAYPELFTLENTDSSVWEALWLEAGDTSLSVGPSTGYGAPINVGSTLGLHNYTIVRESSTSMKCYFDGSLIGTKTTDVGTSRALNRMTYGGYANSPGLWWRGVLGPSKAWSRALTLEEVNREMRTILPRNLESIYECWPAFSGTDRYRGILRARDWTEVGTLSNGDSPPISWGASPIYVNNPAAAGTSILRQMMQHHH